MKKLIVFLIRKRLGLKRGQVFRFDGQKSDTVYWFDKLGIWRVETKSYPIIHFHEMYNRSRSSVSLTWLLDDECSIDIWDEKEQDWVMLR